MKTYRISTLAIIAATAFAGTAFAADTTSNQAFEASNQKMMQDMQGMKMSGNADMDFAMMMARHHQGAIDMANIELQYGKDKEMRDMAQKMITKQQQEIKQLKDWQARHAK